VSCRHCGNASEPRLVDLPGGKVQAECSGCSRRGRAYPVTIDGASQLAEADLSGSGKRHKGKTRKAPLAKPAPDSEPNWSGSCMVCGASPTVPVTSMCGPCTFGEADTAGGNW